VSRSLCGTQCSDNALCLGGAWAWPCTKWWLLVSTALLAFWIYLISLMQFAHSACSAVHSCDVSVHSHRQVCTVTSLECTEDSGDGGVANWISVTVDS